MDNNALAALPPELSAIRELLGNRKEQYRQACWLQSDFDAVKWTCVFEHAHDFTLDFGVLLPDGRLLSDGAHKELCETLKCWLCVQTHPDKTGILRLASRSMYRSVRQAVKLIDFFLLNADRFSLHLHGLGLLTEGDIRASLAAIGQQSETSETIYRWSDTLAAYLNSHSRQLDEKTIEQALIAQPTLSTIPTHEEEWVLPLTRDQLIRARIWLYCNEYYRNGTHIEFDKGPNTRLLCAVLYRHTLGKPSFMPIFDELCLVRNECNRREFTGVDVRISADPGMNEKEFQYYCKIIRSLELLRAINLPVPTQALSVTRDVCFKELVSLSKPGRFRTLSSDIIFSSFRRAIEFFLEYGESLVSNYLNICREAISQGKNPLQLQSALFDFSTLLTADLRRLGVKQWTVMNVHSGVPLMAPDNYFELIRGNKGLYELLRVLYGAASFIVGTLMARRQGELLELTPDNCLDINERYLIFYNRKSGFADQRQRIARPIPGVAVNIIKLCKSLQQGLLDLGAIDAWAPLFSRPTLKGIGLDNGNSRSHNWCLDAFSDYFELPLNKDGRRYYIRQHMLRRFFAMLFFWGNSFNRMDTLRWFLGHADVEHLYHYITESIPGAVLQGAKARYITEKIQQRDTDFEENAEALGNLLRRKFGISRFDIMDTDELEMYIEDLMDEGVVTIEPDFFKTANEKGYRVLVKITRDSAHETN